MTPLTFIENRGSLGVMAEPKLLDRMRGVVRARHYSIRTEDA
jgi:hypothetical protein